MRELILLRGEIAMVDDEDYERLSRYSWHIMNHGYVARTYIEDKAKKVELLHRAIMQTPTNMDTDHIDGDKLNNTKANLRIVTTSQNCMNRRPKENKVGSVKYKGVHWCKRSQIWTAQIKVNGKSIYLGRFQSSVDAARAYDAAALSHHGEYARLNFSGVA
jgi:hypothetical protein